MNTQRLLQFEARLQRLRGMTTQYAYTEDWDSGKVVIEAFLPAGNYLADDGDPETHLAAVDLFLLLQDARELLVARTAFDWSGATVPFVTCDWSLQESASVARITQCCIICGRAKLVNAHHFRIAFHGERAIYSSTCLDCENIDDHR